MADRKENSAYIRKPYGRKTGVEIDGNGPTEEGKASGGNSDKPTCSTHDYAEAFRQWQWQHQWWSQMQSSMMMYMMNPMNYYPPMLAHFKQAPLVSSGRFGTTTAAVSPAVAPNQNVSFGPSIQQQHQNGTGPQPPNGRECKIPSLWRRVVAEFLDFLLLFVMKLVVSVMIIEYMDIIDLDKYNLDELLAQNWDSTAALSLTSELVVMEIINRIFICLFETVCLRRGFARSIGGTTPGKYVMRLRVISCQDVVQLQQDNRILVIPGRDIGFWNAFLRSVIKNFSLVFFFPVCFTVVLFPHSRTAYDIASNSVVVEVLPTDLWAWPRRR